MLGPSVPENSPKWLGANLPTKSPRWRPRVGPVTLPRRPAISCLGSAPRDSEAMIDFGERAERAADDPFLAAGGMIMAADALDLVLDGAAAHHRQQQVAIGAVGSAILHDDIHRVTS
jgi:hypothetical protein